MKKWVISGKRFRAQYNGDPSVSLIWLKGKLLETKINGRTKTNIKQAGWTTFFTAQTVVQHDITICLLWQAPTPFVLGKRSRFEENYSPWFSALIVQVFLENGSINVDWFMIFLVWAWEGPTVSSALLHSYFSYFPWLCGILHSQSHVLSIILCCSYVLHFFCQLCPCSFLLFVRIHLIWRYLLHYQAICVFCYLLCLFCTATKSLLTDWVLISSPTSTAGAGISHLVHTEAKPVFFKSLSVGKWKGSEF